MNTKPIWDLRYPPFADTYEIKNPYLSESDKKLLQRAQSFLSQAKSFCLYGEPGVGKSMLLKALTGSLDPKTYQVAYIPYGSVKRNALLRELCEELGIDVSGRGSMLSRLRTYLTSRTDKPFPVVVVDDAQNMEKESFFDLCNLLHSAKSRTAMASIVLCGHGQLKKVLELDIYLAVQTRMAFCFRLNRLDQEQSIAFVRHRLDIAQADPNLIHQDALSLLAADAGGNRRKLMNLCALAMEMAAERGEGVITADLVNSLEGQ